MLTQIVFMGSPDFSIPILKALAEKQQVVGVVTQPDRPAGRGKQLKAPPIKILANELGIPVIQPQKLKDPGVKEQLLEWNPDLIIVAAFGQILRPWVLDMPKYGCINVHASLLPRWRGASPIQAAILHGDAATGVTIMKMDPGIDTGDILTQAEVQILADDTGSTLSGRLSTLGASLLMDTLPGYLDGSIPPQKQDERKATYTGMIKKEAAFLDCTLTAAQLERTIRAYQPWPLARIVVNRAEIAITKARVITGLNVEPAKPYIYQKKPAVGAGNGLLVLDEIIPAGKKAMSGQAYLNGVRNWGPSIS
jgi:methionyl-tRNA formyltransferase